MALSIMSPGWGTLVNTFFGALQGSISVLLTLLAGYIMARRGYLDHKTVRNVSKLCTSLFLPCLLIEEMGPQLTASKLRDVWIIPLWGLLSTILAHGIGWVGKRLMNLPYWTIAASGRPNSNALPLLLLQSLEHTGVLDTLAQPGESVSETLDRAKSLILLNAIVQQCFTFQFTPSIMRLDDSRRKDQDPESQNTLRPGPGRLTSVVQDQERVGLLDDHEHDSDDSDRTRAEGEYRHALDEIADQPDIHWPHRLRPLEKPLKKAWSYMSPPLIGAIIALIIGITPPLHKEILNEDGALYTSVTQAIVNLGELFVVLQTFSVGAELAIVPSAHPGVLAMSWVLFVRFIIMPAIALLFVFATAGRGIYVDDRLVWFLLILIPAGPSAMLLVNVAELVNISQGAIAGYLTIAVRPMWSQPRGKVLLTLVPPQYMISPFMAVVCSAGLEVVSAAAKRVSGV
ncbi:auxin efflux carrier [Trametes punicea]|nr:auxin efflux carrier [Trametes punicea]